MGRQLITINTSHYKGNARFEYRLPASIALDETAKLSLFSVSIYNSTFNISQSAFQNATFAIVFLGTTYSFTIPDGYYSYSDFNAYLQNCMLTAGLYFVDTVKNVPVFPIQILQNNVRYAAQINVLYIPTASEATTLHYALPPGASWTWPSTRQTPQLQLLSAGLYPYFGITPDTPSLFPPTVMATNYTFLSNTYPVVSPVYSYAFCCNLLSNSLSFPTLLFQLPLEKGYGELISHVASTEQKLSVRQGIYQTIQIQLLDQSLVSVLQFRDPEMTLTLLLEY